MSKTSYARRKAHRALGRQFKEGKLDETQTAAYKLAPGTTSTGHDEPWQCTQKLTRPTGRLTGRFRNLPLAEAIAL